MAISTAPPLRHGVARIEQQVDHTVEQPDAARFDQPIAGSQFKVEHDPAADQALEEGRVLFQQGIDLQGQAGVMALARQGHQRTGDVRTAIRHFPDDAGEALYPRVSLRGSGDAIGVEADDREEIVEVVRHEAGNTADAFQQVHAALALPRQVDRNFLRIFQHGALQGEQHQPGHHRIVVPEVRNLQIMRVHGEIGRHVAQGEQPFPLPTAQDRPTEPDPAVMAHHLQHVAGLGHFRQACPPLRPHPAEMLGHQLAQPQFRDLSAERAAESLQMIVGTNHDEGRKQLFQPFEREVEPHRGHAGA